MSDLNPADWLPENPGAVLADWRNIIKRLNDEYECSSSEADRVALLGVFKAIMDMVEGTVAPEDREKFRVARKQNYNLLLVKECLVGVSVCTETAYAVTRREVASGRMLQDDELYTGMTAAMAAPHFTRTELVEQARAKDAGAAARLTPPALEWRRAVAWLRGRFGGSK